MIFSVFSEPQKEFSGHVAVRMTDFSGDLGSLGQLMLIAHYRRELEQGHFGVIYGHLMVHEWIRRNQADQRQPFHSFQWRTGTCNRTGI